MALSDKWTQTQFRVAVQQELMDSAGRWWSDNEINSYVEAWQDIVQHENELVWGTAQLSTTTLSTHTYTNIATDILRPDAVYWNSRRLVVRGVNEMEGLDVNWRSLGTSTSAVGVVVVLDSEKFQLWPAPSAAGNLYMEYPQLLTFSNTTSETKLPAWTRYSCIPYCCYRAYVRPGENNNLNKALRYKMEWEAMQGEIIDVKARYFPNRYPSLKPAGRYEYDILLARRRAPEDIPVPDITLSLHNDEIPTGTVNGTNTTFTLSFSPSPSASLKLWVDGLLYKQGTHYNLSGSTVTFVSAYKPISGQAIFSTYRYVS